MTRPNSFSIRIALISTGILSMALLLKVSVPAVVDFSVYRAPLLWSSILSWLKPPYLYIVLNCIIISIAATSRFHQSHDADHENNQLREEIYFRYNSKISSAEEISSDFRDPHSTVEEVVAELKEEKSSATAAVKALEDKADENELFISKSTPIPLQKMESQENLSDLLLLPAEKPLASTRFSHRRPSKASPEGGRALRVVAKPKRHETLENTWRMITEGRPMPLTRHVKKSETLRDGINDQASPVSNGSSPTSNGVKLRKEPSVSQDELNRRVEAFIKKFNEEMRMQRQQSLDRYREMMNR